MKISVYPLLLKAYIEHKPQGPPCIASAPLRTPIPDLRDSIKPSVDFLCPVVFHSVF